MAIQNNLQWTRVRINQTGTFGSVKLHGHVGHVLTKQIGLPWMWFWDSKESHYHYHAVPSEWLEITND